MGLLDTAEINRFFQILENYKNKNFLDGLSHKSQKRKALVLEFIGDGAAERVQLNPEHLPIVFGQSDKDPAQGQQYRFHELTGENIARQHFEIDYDKESGTIKMRNLCREEKNPVGLYKMLLNNEAYNLLPGDAFRIGFLEFEVERYNTGIVSDRGGRDYMEDYHRYVQQVLCLDHRVQASYYAVFDGHGGYVCAEYCSKHLHLELKRQLEDVLTGIEKSDDLNATVERCITSSFQVVDEMYEKAYPKDSKQCGSTAVVCLIIGNKLYVANAGDARAVLSRNGQAVDLSVDHKAKRADEQHRIKSQGGYIVYGRVLGRLAISRSFGDFDCKNIEIADADDPEKKHIRNFVMVEPEIHIVDLAPTHDEFIFLASDGLFDRYSSQQCVDTLRQYMLKNPLMEQSAQTAAVKLIEKAKKKRMMQDNITVIVVALNRGIEAPDTVEAAEEEAKEEKE